MTTRRQQPTLERQKKVGRKFRRVGGRIKEAIEEAVLEKGWRAPEIHEDLKERFRKRAPTLRTVERWVNKIAPHDPSGPWRFVDADPQDAALVLPVLAVAGVRPLTVGEADWIIRLRRAVPQMHPEVVRPMARQYMSYLQRNLSTESLDQILAQLCRPKTKAEKPPATAPKKRTRKPRSKGGSS